MFSLIFLLMFQVSCIVQVVGIILSLHAATKISHRAQNIGSLASRWHAVATCSPDSSRVQHSTSLGSLPCNSSDSMFRPYSESDLESLDYIDMPNSRLASFVSSYHKRQSFGMDFPNLFFFCFFPHIHSISYLKHKEAIDYAVI